MNFYLRLKTTVLSSFFILIGRNQIHQISKFKQIYNIWSNIYLDNLEGDYIEFGIFRGKSLLHSFKTYKSIFKKGNVKFHGLDSFDGFPVENHDFYTNINFQSSNLKVERFFSKYSQIKIHSGFFNETLKASELQDSKFSFAFIDCDIYESANDAFLFLKSRMVNGGFIMIDDLTSIDKNSNTIYKSFVEHFKIGEDVVLFSTYSNGQVYRYFNNLL